MRHCSASQVAACYSCEVDYRNTTLQGFLVFSRCVRPSLQALVVLKDFFVQELTSSTDIVNPVSSSPINFPVEFLLSGDGSECTVEFLELFYHPQYPSLGMEIYQEATLEES